MSRSALSAVPSLRILLPFCVGILVAGVSRGHAAAMALLLSGITAWLVLSALSRSPLRRLSLRPWWVLPVFLLSSCAGVLAVRAWEPRPVDLTRLNGHTVAGRVDKLETYDFSMRLHVRLMADGETPTSPTVLLTTRGCDYLLREGDVVVFCCDLQPVSNLGNPEEHDRQDRLWQQGIAYCQHLSVARLRIIGHRPTLQSRASACRRWLVSRMLVSSLAPRSQNLLAALLLGDSRMVESGVRDQFSHAGIAHILALSGLHVGLICSLFWLLLFPLDYLGLKKLRLGITLLALVAFCFITGLSPSVMRATIMIGFALVGVILYRKSVSLNAMCLSALLILAIWPAAIFQAGFQLSFVTVGVILLFHDRLLTLAGRRHRRLRGIWSTASISLLAMVSTAGLTAYYFCSISIASVVSNLLVLPVMPALMLLGIVFMFLAAMGQDWPAINSLIDGINGYMLGVSSWVSGLPLSHVSGIFVTAPMVWTFYLLLALLAAWLLSRRARWLLGALASLAVLLCLCWNVKRQQPSQGMVVLNDYRSTPLLWHEQGAGYAWMPDNPSPDTAQFAQTHRRLLARMGVERLHWVGDSVRSSFSLIRPPFAYIQGRRILLAGTKSSYIRPDSSQATPVDLIVVTKRFHGHLPDLVKLYPCRRIVLSGALPTENRRQLADQCRQLSIECQQAPFAAEAR